MRFDISQDNRDVMKLLKETDINVTMNAYEALILTAVFIDNSKDEAHKNLSSVLGEYKISKDTKDDMMRVLSAQTSMMRSSMSLMEAKILNEVMGARFKDENA